MTHGAGNSVSQISSVLSCVVSDKLSLECVLRKFRRSADNELDEEFVAVSIFPDLFF